MNLKCKVNNFFDFDLKDLSRFFSENPFNDSHNSEKVYFKLINLLSILCMFTGYIVIGVLIYFNINYFEYEDNENYFELKEYLKLFKKILSFNTIGDFNKVNYIRNVATFLTWFHSLYYLTSSFINKIKVFQKVKNQIEVFFHLKNLYFSKAFLISGIIIFTGALQCTSDSFYLNKINLNKSFIDISKPLNTNDYGSLVSQKSYEELYLINDNLIKRKDFLNVNFLIPNNLDIKLIYRNIDFLEIDRTKNN